MSFFIALEFEFYSADCCGAIHAFDWCLFCGSIAWAFIMMMIVVVLIVEITREFDLFCPVPSFILFEFEKILFGDFFL